MFKSKLFSALAIASLTIAAASPVMAETESGGSLNTAYFSVYNHEVPPTVASGPIEIVVEADYSCLDNKVHVFYLAKLKTNLKRGEQYPYPIDQGLITFTVASVNGELAPIAPFSFRQSDFLSSTGKVLGNVVVDEAIGSNRIEYGHLVTTKYKTTGGKSEFFEPISNTFIMECHAS